MVDRFEKIANYPDVPTVTAIIARTLKNYMSSPLLVGFQDTPYQVSVESNIGEKSQVYFQLAVDPKRYENALANKTQITQYLAPLIGKALSDTFRLHDFNVTIGIVPIM
jgi:hypothetical protein